MSPKDFMKQVVVEEPEEPIVIKGSNVFRLSNYGDLMANNRPIEKEICNKASS